jgi:hypothetical protein
MNISDLSDDEREMVLARRRAAEIAEAKISDLTDEELESLSTARLSDLAWGAAYSGTAEDTQRVSRVLRKRCQAATPLLPSNGWPLPYDPDDDCEERGIVD